MYAIATFWPAITLLNRNGTIIWQVKFCPVTWAADAALVSALFARIAALKLATVGAPVVSGTRKAVAEQLTLPNLLIGCLKNL